MQLPYGDPEVWSWSMGGSPPSGVSLGDVLSHLRDMRGTFSQSQSAASTSQNWLASWQLKALAENVSTASRPVSPALDVNIVRRSCSTRNSRYWRVEAATPETRVTCVLQLQRQELMLLLRVAAATPVTHITTVLQCNKRNSWYDRVTVQQKKFTILPCYSTTKETHDTTVLQCNKKHSYYYRVAFREK